LVIRLDLVAARRGEVAEIRPPECALAGFDLHEFPLMVKRPGTLVLYDPVELSVTDPADAVAGGEHFFIVR